MSSFNKFVGRGRSPEEVRRVLNKGRVWHASADKPFPFDELMASQVEPDREAARDASTALLDRIVAERRSSS